MKHRGNDLLKHSHESQHYTCHPFVAERTRQNVHESVSRLPRPIRCEHRGIVVPDERRALSTHAQIGRVTGAGIA